MPETTETVTAGKVDDASLAFRRLHVATIIVAMVEHLRPFALPIGLLILSSFNRRQSAEDIGELVGAVIGVLLIFPAVMRYFTFRFAITDKTLEVLVRQNRSIPLERIQNVDVKRNLLHQLLRVAVLKVETAGGTGAEAELSVVALSDVDNLVLELRSGLRAPPQSGDGVVTPIDRVPEPPPAVYVATTKQLFVAGATENRAMAIVAILIGLLGQPGSKSIKGLVDRLEDVRILQAFSSTTIWVALLAVFWILLIAVGWIYSILATVIGQFGFTLRSEGEVLSVKRGLTTQYRSVVPVKRIQGISIREPWLQRWLGYAQVKATAAAAFDDKQMAGMLPLCPIIERDRVDDILELASPGARLQPQQWQTLHPKAYRLPLRRFLLLAIIVCTLVAGFGWWMRGDVPRFWVASLRISAGFGAFSLLAGILSAFATRATRWSLEDGFLYLKTGLVSKTTQVVGADRVQFLGAEQSPAEKRLSAKSVTVHTAASSGGHVSIPHLPIEVAQKLIADLQAASAIRSAGV
jgi:putative membrane protein